MSDERTKEPEGSGPEEGWKWKATPDEPDTEGHGRRVEPEPIMRRSEQDEPGVGPDEYLGYKRAIPDDQPGDDTEGHVRGRSAIPDDAEPGEFARRETEDQPADTEGHGSRWFQPESAIRASRGAVPETEEEAGPDGAVRRKG